MPTYDVIVSDELLPEFVDPSGRKPAGFRVVAVEPAQPATEGTVLARGTTRVRVEDDNAPPWTEGKLISPVFTADYEANDAGHPTGNVTLTVTEWTEVTA